MTTKIYGIDLGTTYSCIAHVDEYGKAMAIQNAEGEQITPSVIYFESADNRVVGKEAKNVAVMYPGQVVEMVKRQMGQPHWLFHYEGTDYSAEEISSYILRKVVQDAEEYLNCEIKDVVITCPAYFGINEREATANAGRIAGLNVHSIINEPTAAAIAYSLQSSQSLAEQPDEITLVYDLGGGTFDITMIEKKGSELTVIATGGHHQLGGKDWDKAIVDYLAHQWQEITGNMNDPRDDPEDAQDLFLKAETAKQSLGRKEKTEIAVVHEGQREKIELTREKFDELTSSLLEQTIQYTRSMLDEAAKKGYHQFDQILLVGGSTRMPQVVERLRQEFGLEPRMYDPDQAVAKGAALYGLKLAVDEEIRIRFATNEIKEISSSEKEKIANEFGLPGAKLDDFVGLKARNVSSRSFGVISLMADDQGNYHEVVSNLILVNTAVPVEAQQHFRTVQPNQEEANIRITESLISEEVIADFSLCNEISMAVLSLPPGLPQHSPVEITFQLDEQGRLHAVARELSANRVVEVEVQTSSVISEADMTEAMERSTHLTVS